MHAGGHGLDGRVGGGLLPAGLPRLRADQALHGAARQGGLPYVPPLLCLLCRVSRVVCGGGCVLSVGSSRNWVDRPTDGWMDGLTSQPIGRDPTSALTTTIHPTDRSVRREGGRLRHGAVQAGEEARHRRGARQAPRAQGPWSIDLFLWGGGVHRQFFLICRVCFFP